MGFNIMNAKLDDIANALRSFRSGIPHSQPTLAETDELDEIIGEPDLEQRKLAGVPTAEDILRGRFTMRTLADIPAILPEEQDTSILFRHNWLAKGQGMMLVSSSGVGKSSMVMQMAYFWSLGIPWLAEPMRPLKIAIIQGEDSERDLQEQREGMRRGLKDEFVWTDEMVAKAESSIVISPDFVGVAGDRFIERLKDFQATFKFDLIFVNPVQSYFGADLSSQEDTSHFVREGLDPIMKNPDSSCCICLVAHTAKVKSGTRDGRQNVNDYGEYLMAGSQEWTAWTRAALAFMKNDANQEHFDFAQVKRARLGWRDWRGEPVTKKVFRHSDGFIFWHELKEDELVVHREEPPESDLDTVNAFAALLASYIKRHDAMCATRVKDECKAIGIRKKDYRTVFDALVKCAGKHGLMSRDFAVKRSGAYTTFVGTETQLRRMAERYRQADALTEMRDAVESSCEHVAAEQNAQQEDFDDEDIYKDY